MSERMCTDRAVPRRWDSTYESVRMQDVPHRRLTRPKKVFEFFFDGAVKSTAQEGVIKLEPVADGCLNAICFWFDLHLDEEATLTSAPPGIGKGGQTDDGESPVRRGPVRMAASASAQAVASWQIGAQSCSGSRELVPAADSAPQASPGSAGASHYWGQALQYLERSTQARSL